MARLARLALAGQLHLLVQRGHNGEPVFGLREDRIDYLQQLRQAAAAERVAVHAYGLEPSQALLLATPDAADGLGRMMQAVSRTFVARYNRRHGRQGALWQGRFGCAVVDPATHGLATLRCVESAFAWRKEGAAPSTSRPDAEAAAASDPSSHSVATWDVDDEDDEDVTVSSAPHHRGQKVIDWLAETSVYWQLGNTPFEREVRYRALASISPQDGNLLLRAARRGWPLGAQRFFGSLGVADDRAMTPRRPGRPPRST